MTTAARPEAAPLSFREHVAGEVRAHLGRRAMSGRTLARLIDRDQTWVSRRLNGTTPMTTDDVEMVASALGLTPMQLIFGGPISPEGRVTYHGSNSGNPHGNVVDLAERRHASGPIDQVEAA